MAVPFTKLKLKGLPRASAKFSKLAGERKLKSISIKQPKVPKGKKLKDFNFSKYIKVAKLPKSKKVTLIKMVIKKIKR